MNKQTKVELLKENARIKFTHRRKVLEAQIQLEQQIDGLKVALWDIANRAKRIREDKAVVGIEASYIERIAHDAINKQTSHTPGPYATGQVLGDVRKALRKAKNQP